MAENIQLAGLVVDLLLNTASFEAGSTKAQRIANKAAKDIDREFRAVQGALGGIFARMGPLGEMAASALDQVGSAASKAMEKLGGMGKGVGTVGAVAAGALTALTVAAAAASAAVVDVAVHAAESAAKMEDLAHSTGISVEGLSKLQAVGHMIAPDVSIDDIAKSLGRMNRQIVEAASASATTITPFQRMGISIRDASGQMKTGEEIFAEIGGKFSSMQDGAIKSGLAMQIFGRSGASIIPILDEGGEKIAHIVTLAEKFGAVIDTETAESAHKFKENIAELELALQGIENRLMIGLLPALTGVTKALDDLAEGTTYTDQRILDATDGLGSFQTKADSLAPIIHDLVEMVKLWIPILADMAITIGFGVSELGGFIKNMFTLLDLQREVAKHPIKFLFEGPLGMDNIRAQVVATDKEVERMNDDLINLGAHLYNAVNAPAAEKRTDLFSQIDELKNRLRKFDESHVNLKSNQAKEAELTIEAQIKKLQGQADAEGILAQAISAESAATIENIAHADALKTISELNAAAQKYGVSVTKEQAAAIEQATLRLEAYKAALKVNKDLQENIDKTKIAIESEKALAAAYDQGGEAIEKAKVQMELAPLKDAVNDLQELHDKLGQLPLTGKSAELFNTLGKSLQDAQDKLKSDTTSVTAKHLQDAAVAASQLGNNLRFDAEELQKQIAATLQGADALREFNAQKQIDVFVHEHPGVLTQDQIAGLRQQSATMADDEEKLQVVQKFRSENNVRSIADEINELTKYHDLLVRDSNDELVYQGKMHDLLQAQQRAWDELLLKTNDAGAGVRAFFDDMAFNGETAAERIHNTLTSTFNALEDTFARFVSGQKVSWKELENQIVATLAKQSIDVLLRGGITSLGGALNGKLGGQQEAMNEKIPGAGPIGIGSTIATLFGMGGKTAAPGSSPTNPIYTRSVDLVPGATGGLSDLSSLALSKAPSGISSILSGISTVLPFMAAGGGHVSGPGTSTSDSIPAMLSAGEYVLKADTVKRIGKTHLDAINSGHPIARFAQGGAVTPGGSYLASERRSFASMPERSVAMAPMVDDRAWSSGATAQPVFNFNGVADADTFKRSRSQLMAFYRESMYSASQRQK